MTTDELIDELMEFVRHADKAGATKQELSRFRFMFRLIRKYGTAKTPNEEVV